MLVVGLTGQTGSGKTTVGKCFEELGMTIVDADNLARSLIENDPDYIAALLKEFGPDIADKNGGIDRKKLGVMIFADEKKRLRFNEIAFPVISRAISELLDKLRAQGVKIAVLDAPTLFESGSHSLCDKIISVTAHEDIRRPRIMARDNLSYRHAQDRMDSQHPDSYYTQRSDYVLDGGLPLEKLMEAARILGEKLMENKG